MDVRKSFIPVALIALLCASLPAHAQSQADRTGTGGVAPAAGQESGSLTTTAIIVGGVIAAAVGIAVAVSSGDNDNTSASVATVTSTSTR